MQEPRQRAPADDNGILNIEDVFASLGRTKVIWLLVHAANNEMNISEIVRKSKLNHQNVEGHLKRLVALGLVQDKPFGRIRIFRLRVEEKRVRALKNFVDFFQGRLFELPSPAGGVSQRV